MSDPEQNTFLPVRLSERLLARLKRAAKREARPLSQWVRLVLEREAATIEKKNAQGA